MNTKSGGGHRWRHYNPNKISVIPQQRGLAEQLYNSMQPIQPKYLLAGETMINAKINGSMPDKIVLSPASLLRNPTEYINTALKLINENFKAITAAAPASQRNKPVVSETNVVYDNTSSAQSLKFGNSTNPTEIKKIGIIIFMRNGNDVVAVLKNTSNSLDFFGIAVTQFDSSTPGVPLAGAPPLTPVQPQPIETYARYAACLASANTFIVKAQLNGLANNTQHVDIKPNPANQTEIARYYFVNINVQNSKIMNEIESIYQSNIKEQSAKLGSLNASASIVKIPLTNIITACRNKTCAPGQVNDINGASYQMHSDLQQCIIEFLNLPDNATNILNKIYKVNNILTYEGGKVKSIVVNENNGSQNNQQNNSMIVAQPILSASLPLLSPGINANIGFTVGSLDGSSPGIIFNGSNPGIIIGNSNGYAISGKQLYTVSTEPFYKNSNVSFTRQTINQPLSLSFGP